MKFKIISKPKKKGGRYYILLSTDEYGFKRIWGRYKTRAKVETAKRRLEAEYR